MRPIVLFIFILFIASGCSEEAEDPTPFDYNKMAVYDSAMRMYWIPSDSLKSNDPALKAERERLAKEIAKKYPSPYRGHYRAPQWVIILAILFGVCMLILIIARSINGKNQSTP